MILTTPIHVYNTEHIRDSDERLLDMFPDYNYHMPIPAYLTRRKYAHPKNIVGYQQRCFNYFWALNTVWGTGELGVEIGSHGVRTPYCLSTDIEQFQGVDMIVNGTELPFSDGSISLLLANHVIEHLGMPIPLLFEHWHTKLKDGAIIAAIMPDQKFNDVMKIDSSHEHAPSSETFKDLYLDTMTIFEIIEYDTLNNGFSFNIVLQKV